MSSPIDKVLRDAVAAGHVPQVVAIAAHDGGVIYEGSAGPRVAGSDEQVVADSHFRIMSMTKMVVTVAALQLVEQGKLELDAPVDIYCPEFANLQVLEGFDRDTPKLRAPAGRAAVEHLLTHTSGLSYWFWNADIVKWEAVTGGANVLSGTKAALSAPLVADPGAKFEYGINTDWLGQVIEAASGARLDAYVRDNVTGPLGMDETAFLMTEEERARSVPIHVRGEDGRWTATDIDISRRPEYYAGGHGLYSTPRDYLRFQRMLLGDGTFNGTKILDKTTVDAAFTNQIGDLSFPEAIRTADPASSHDLELGPGLKWGYGLLLNTEQQPGMRAVGSGAWAGLCNTHFWIDRTTRVTGAIYSQFLPFAPPEALQLYADFERALYASL